MKQVLFPVAATKGWAGCNHAKQVERSAALRNLLLAGSGCLQYPQGMVGMDSLDKLVEQISFLQCVTFCEHRQLTGWQPHSNPLLLKAQSPHIAIVDMANGKKNIPIFRNKPWRPQLRDQTYASLHETQASGRKWRLRFHKRHGFLRQAC